MKLDLKAFADKLKTAEEAENIDILGNGVKYLYELMHFYASSDTGMEVGEIDFNQFDSFDIENFREIYNRIYGKFDKANRLCNLFAKISPKAVKGTSAFF